MDERYQNALDTRRLYAFEAAFTRQFPAYTRNRRGIKSLRRLLARVWADQGRGKMPKLIAGRGTRFGGHWCSYTDGEKIVLARHHRNAAALLHEIAHCLVPWRVAPHGPEFARMFHLLLVRYGRVDEGFLQFAMMVAGVRT